MSTSKPEEIIMQVIERPSEVIPQVETLPELKIRHTVDQGTLLIGTTKDLGPRISAIMGRNGQHWCFSHNLPIGAGWYVKGSRNGGADMPRLIAARRALVADGFPVSIKVESTDLAPNLSKAELARRAQARSQAVSSLAWHLSTPGGLRCTRPGCAVMELHADTARIINDPQDGSPRVECLTHPADAPTVDMPAVGAPIVLPEEPEDRDESEPAPAPRRVREPGTRPSPYPRTRTARAAAPTAKPAPVPTGSLGGLASLAPDMLAWFVESLAPEAREALKASLGVTSAKPRARKAPVVASVVAAVSAPPASAPVLAPETGPMVLVAALTGDARAKATASDLRRNLYSQVTNGSGMRKFGIEIHAYLDRDARTVSVTITSAGASPEARERIVRKALAAMTGTRGVERAEVEVELAERV